MRGMGLAWLIFAFTVGGILGCTAEVMDGLSPDSPEAAALSTSPEPELVGPVVERPLLLQDTRCAAPCQRYRVTSSTGAVITIAELDAPSDAPDVWSQLREQDLLVYGKVDGRRLVIDAVVPPVR